MDISASNDSTTPVGNNQNIPEISQLSQESNSTSISVINNVSGITTNNNTRGNNNNHDNVNNSSSNEPNNEDSEDSSYNTATNNDAVITTNDNATGNNNNNDNDNDTISNEVNNEDSEEIPCTESEKAYEPVFPKYVHNNDNFSQCVYAACDWDSCAAISTSCKKVLHVITAEDTSTLVHVKLNKMINDDGSRMCINSTYDPDYNNNFRPWNQYGSYRPPSIRLCSFKNITIASTQQGFGMDFFFRLYVLDANRVPLNSMFTEKDLCALAITMNLCMKKKALLDTYNDLEYMERNDFDSIFERTIAFTVSGGEVKFIKSPSTHAKYFFSMLWETWEKIHKDTTRTTVGVNNMLDFDDEYATNNNYLPDDLNKITNKEIINFCHDIFHNSCFAGNAFGFKTSFAKKPKSVIDLQYPGEFDLFCKKSITILKKEIHSLNMKRFHSYITDNERDDSCPLIFTNDYAVELTPVNPNTSIVINGFLGRRIMEFLLKAKKRIEKNNYRQHKDYATGMLYCRDIAHVLFLVFFFTGK